MRINLQSDSVHERFSFILRAVNLAYNFGNLMHMVQTSFAQLASKIYRGVTGPSSHSGSPRNVIQNEQTHSV